ncbi:AAA family ATPase [Priestia megaterium]|uniref:AAA family ATPase n=1 Tax=Priestia megaterium TaxID=1404 RepID=UPI001FB42216|nr:AAA family ATPase [Priestia megaterium]
MFYIVNYYKQANYAQYVEERRKKDINILTFPFLEVHQNNMENIFTDREIDLDLTSAVKMMDQNEAIPYFLEKMVCILDTMKDTSITFIVCEKYLEPLLNVFPYFSKGTEVEIEVQTTESNKAELITEVHESFNKIKIVDKENFERLKKALDNQLIGHEAFKQNIIKELEVYKYFNKQIKDQPIFSLFLLGPSGTGKTEIGRTLHRYLDDDSPVAKINLANYKSESSLSSLIGSPPGYIGSQEDSDLVRKIKISNAGVLIIDEFEKADGAIHNFFLQLLEEGRFDDALGNIHDLDGYIIVFTSNFSKEDFIKEVPSELRSRFNLVFECSYLNTDDRKKYVEKSIKGYIENTEEELSQDDLEKIVQTINYSEESNLRNLKNW